VGPPLTPDDERFLREALALAERGRHDVEPNPPVGCVLARGGEVVGRGWHRAYGGAHAEVEALRDAGARARDATAYVSLEPCSTHGKTGPCTEALRSAGVREVVWAFDDPTPAHAGRAAAVLAGAGVATRRATPAGAADPAAPILRHALARSRPWTVLKWAMSADGRTSPAAGRGGRLSGDAAMRFVHDLRGRVEAVAVGIGTVLSDDPVLTCRLPGGTPEGRPQPLRVVFDSGLRIPVRSALVGSASEEAPLLVVYGRGETSDASGAARRDALARAGVSFLAVGDEQGLDVEAALDALHARGVRRLLVEGGTRLATAFVRAEVVDQVFCLLAPLLLGGEGAPTPLGGTGVADVGGAPRLAGVRAHVLEGGDVLVRGYAGDAAAATAATRS
jgi:diaminohydroxyphosphoribosylaminopyrimidine deaminase/5-amino-6-(5-phosphoribosylamino)uracil reductase